MRRSRTSSARRRPMTKPKDGSSAPSRSLDLARNQHGYADLKADADGVITATLAEPGQVVRRRPGRGAARSSWREGSRGRACPRLGSPRPASPGRSCGCGPTASVPSTRGCASSHRRPTPRPAPTPRASPSTQADDAVAFGMTATVTLTPSGRREGRAGAALGDSQPRHRTIGLRRRCRPARSQCGR